MIAMKLLNEIEAHLVINELERSYPNAKYYLNFKTPIDLLVAAIISAQTRDEVVNAVTPEIFRRYKKASDYASADIKEFTQLISKVSFAGNKAKNIISTCSIIAKEFNDSVPDKPEELMSLPGIGRKTANTILINAYGKVYGIPVDTWVIKLSYRIGLSGEKNPDKIEKDLMKVVEKKEWARIAYVLKAHGKKICQSKVPICSICPIKSLCPRNGVSKSK